MGSTGASELRRVERDGQSCHQRTDLAVQHPGLQSAGEEQYIDMVQSVQVGTSQVYSDLCHFK